MTGLFMTPTLARSRFLFGWAHDHPAAFKQTEDPDHTLNIFGISTHIQQMLISKFSYFIILFENCCYVASMAADWTDRGSNPGRGERFSLLQNV